LPFVPVFKLISSHHQHCFLFGPSNSDTTTARLLFSGTIALLVVPLCIPGVVCAKDWFHRSFHSFRLQAWSGFIHVDADNLEIHKELPSRHAGSIGSVGQGSFHHSSENGVVNGINGQEFAGEIEGCGCCQRTIAKDQLAMLGEEHPAPTVVRRSDFWLYCLAYFCGGTIGLVYGNNLGQIAQSVGQGSALHPIPHFRSLADCFQLHQTTFVLTTST
ncbi:protein NUCLEAR FUSION DEFECTIVE 4-like, partial [Carya illinoinensis]|uniref:protein NUCLEAR FUSION DEFECTIVE 4-like n=1 Tax=Carya illinoinensis TaxID=32201 RepID=UPI001C71DCD6